MEVVIAILVELFGLLLGNFCSAVISGMFGSLAGLLYPPKSPLWARWQLVGFASGALAIVAIGLGFAWLKPPLARPAIAVGAVFLVSYLVIGNTCRIFHERRGCQD